MRGCFRDVAAYERALAEGNSLVYTVTSMEATLGEGDLHYGFGTLWPGVVGDEYFLTKGHLHSWRMAAEVYIGLAGRGAMLLQDESSGESLMVPFDANSVVYVPGHTAHRTINVGDVPLVYLGVYPAAAGHDYETIAKGNFRSVVVKREGKPCLLPRNSP
jgi:glucose-6-phosphate isomerase